MYGLRYSVTRHYNECLDCVLYTPWFCCVGSAYDSVQRPNVRCSVVLQPEASPLVNQRYYFLRHTNSCDLRSPCSLSVPYLFLVTSSSSQDDRPRVCLATTTSLQDIFRYKQYEYYRRSSTERRFICTASRTRGSAECQTAKTG